MHRDHDWSAAIGEAQGARLLGDDRCDRGQPRQETRTPGEQRRDQRLGVAAAGVEACGGYRAVAKPPLDERDALS